MLLFLLWFFAFLEYDATLYSRWLNIAKLLFGINHLIMTGYWIGVSALPRVKNISPIPLWQFSPAIAVILEHFCFGDYGAERWFCDVPIDVQCIGFVY